jgi:pimeloyl-ACP methyl ester carboxylesterase
LRGGSQTWPTPRARGLAICGSDAIKAALGRDPLNLDRIDTLALLQAYRIVRFANRTLERARGPILCVQGAKDPVTSAARNRELFDRPPRREFVSVEDGFHDLGLEPGNGDVDRIVLGWLARRRVL